VSVRKGYWLVTPDGAYDGPYQSLAQAKGDTDTIEGTVTVQALVALERRDETGKWVTLQ